MIYICVCTYGNGRYQNKVFPMYFKRLRDAEVQCEKLTKDDRDGLADDKWIPFPIYGADEYYD